MIGDQLSEEDEMEHAGSFRELLVYQKALGVSRRFFELSKSFPAEEKYSLTDQGRRSSRSIGAQIAVVMRFNMMGTLTQVTSFPQTYPPLTPPRRGSKEGAPLRPLSFPSRIGEGTPIVDPLQGDI